VPAKRRDVKFLIGSMILSFVKVVEAARLHLTGLPHEANNAMLLELYRQLVHPERDGPRRPGSHQLFADVRRKGCSEPLDKIFALHGILQIIDPNYPLPDYRRNAVDVFTEAAVWTMVHQGEPRMLYYAFTQQREINHSKLSADERRRLPSWVPDFTLPQNRVCKITHQTMVRYNTTRNSRPTCRLVDGDRKLLRISGYFCSIVEECSPHLMPKFRNFYFGQREFMSQACETCLAWFKVLAPIISAVGIDTVEQAFVEFAAHWEPRIDANYISKFVRALQEAHEYRMNDSPLRDIERVWEQIEIGEDSGAPRFLTRPEGWDDLSLTRQNWMLMNQALEDLSCVTTEAGALGFGFGDIRIGDRPTLISGLDLIFFLRSSGTSWVLRGMGYLFGFMDGTVWPANEDTLEEIDLA